MFQVLIAISQRFVAKKRHGAMQKLFIKKEEKKRIEKKWTIVQDIENNRYSDTHLKKEEMNKIAPVLSQKYFQVSRERYVFKEHSRIRIATTDIHLIYPHTCTS